MGAKPVGAGTDAKRRYSSRVWEKLSLGSQQRGLLWGEVGGSSPLVNALFFSLGDPDLLFVSPAVSPKQTPYLWQNQEEDKGGKGDFVCGVYLFIYLFIAAWEGRNKVGFQVGLLQ